MNETGDLFLVAAGWAAILAYLVRFIPDRLGRIATFVVLLAVPFWELPYGYYNFRQLCNEQAKLQVFEKVLPQTSVCVRNLDSLLYAHLIKAGFSRIEVLNASDDARRDVDSGKVFRTGQKDLRSGYCLAFKGNISLPWHVAQHDTLIARSSDGYVVARQSVFDWWGMWWQRDLLPALGRGGSCFADPSLPLKALRNGIG